MLDYYPYNAPEPKPLPDSDVTITLPGPVLLEIRNAVLDQALILEGESMVSRGWLKDHEALLAQFDKALWPTS